ncbi:MAG: hypothetical protein LC732_03240 [Acidobacteria bacterium]|nr:hypothetical protein [Acidobacteriota bacterium]
MSAASPLPIYGGDRLAVKPDGVIVLSSRWDKGWVPRREKELVHAAFPGTCIEWGDEHFEVVRADPAGSGVRYLLLPWDDANAIRTMERYDEESERLRAEKREADETRGTRRKLTIGLSLVLGNLPAAMQEEMESEYGVRASRLTLVSIVPLFIWGAPSVLFTMASIGGAPPPVPRPLLLPGLYFFAESLFRFAYAMSTGKPIGSFPVVLIASTIRQVSGRGRKAPPKLGPPPIEPSVARRDAFHVREPYLALLTPEEQLDLAARFDFDPILWGKRTAWLILLFAILGIVTGVSSGGFTGWTAVLAAGYCAGEQLARLRRLGRGVPAGSIFGTLVRPMTRALTG